MDAAGGQRRGVEDFTLFSLSPPQRLSANGKTLSRRRGYQQRSQNYAEYAQYLADIIKHFDGTASAPPSAP